MAVRNDFAAGEVLAATDLNDTFAAKLAYATPTNAQTGTTYTFVLADANKLVTASNAAASTYTIPPQSSVVWVTNTILRVSNLGAGVVTFAGGVGVTVTNTAATLAQFQTAYLIRTASDAWTVLRFGENAGVKQVKSTSTTASFSTNSTTYADWTNLNVSITPSSTSNKIMVFATVATYTSAGGISHFFAIVRGSTTVAEQQSSAIGNGYYFPVALSYLDSPATTSATTYKIQVKTSNATYAVSAASGMTYTITAMEVAP